VGSAFDVDNNNNNARSLVETMILLSYAFLVLAARGFVKDFFGNGSRVEFFILEGRCLDVSTRAVGMYSIFTAPYILLTVSGNLAVISNSSLSNLSNFDTKCVKNYIYT
jgi:hypothetical protein